ncbi:MFS transporter [Paractinoplanes brasiliensis]|uniref:Outer membrane biosynthesis protein TonB n=1 Tax=Paractinoplanes brasiliensis TaxID=52695 RepID=A0A4R6J8S7_9ACTN|nr:MFS transporter [Actinoplanes brasiliensis]TDO31567.1 outer membrane biosynthesis protein TonB [Actinoplanes brasiliensis]GID30965.1 hypothetical protein Abr02nite_59480 [Actinoplanes brasiliensis]
MPVIQGHVRVFYQLLVNTLLVSVTNFTVWFAITFYTYLETRSVFATGVISGIFLVMTALTGIWFGSLVDHHPKKTMMQISAGISLTTYVLALVLYQLTPREQFRDPASVPLWGLIVLLMVGVIAGNIRTIALPTMVTALIAEGTRDRANGLVGTASGVSFLVTSVISGLLVALGGMLWVLVTGIVVLALALTHLALVRVPTSLTTASDAFPADAPSFPAPAITADPALAPPISAAPASTPPISAAPAPAPPISAAPAPAPPAGAPAVPARIEAAAGATPPPAAPQDRAAVPNPGASAATTAPAGAGAQLGTEASASQRADADPRVKIPPVPGAEANSGGIDLRGTMRVIAGVPGLTALIIFSAFNNLLGGVFMALLDAYGLSMMSVQGWGLLWGVLSTGFIVGGLLVSRTGLGHNPVRLLLLINIVCWTVTLLFPLRASIIWLAIGLYAYMLVVPYAEAAEQTILQKVVPYERQGRVFGFAQSVEQAASPLTAFLISPLAQFVFIPFMTDGAGARLIGSWFGTGAARGLALVFMITGVAGLIVTAVALRSRPYRRLSTRYTTAA